MQNQPEEVIGEKKKNNSANSKPLATKIVTQYQQTITEKHKQNIQTTFVVIKRDSILHVIIHERLSRKGRVVKVYNFGDVTVNDMKYYVVQLIRKEPSFVIIHPVTNDRSYLTSQKI